MFLFPLVTKMGFVDFVCSKKAIYTFLMVQVHFKDFRYMSFSIQTLIFYYAGETPYKDKGNYEMKKVLDTGYRLQNPNDFCPQPV